MAAQKEERLRDCRVISLSTRSTPSSGGGAEGAVDAANILSPVCQEASSGGRATTVDNQEEHREGRSTGEALPAGNGGRRTVWRILWILEASGHV